jgi:hypothetical protein
MRPIYQVFGLIVAIMIFAAIIFFAFGGNPPETKEVPQENVPAVPTVETVEPVPTPTQQCAKRGDLLVCTYIEVRHPVNSSNSVAVDETNRPILLETEGVVDWGSSQMTLSTENLGFWMGRSNIAWKESSRETVYQKIFSYVRDYRHGVKIESAKFDKLIVSRSPAIHLMKDVFVGGEYMNVGIRAYATTFTNPNDESKEVEMVFFYDKEDDIIAFGYGDANNIATKKNFVISGGEGGGSNSDGNGGATDTTTTDTTTTTTDTEGPVGDVPS